MQKEIIIEPEAKSDIRNASIWYENADPGLGEKFVTAIREAFLLLSKSDKAFPKVIDDIRKYIVDAFPFGIFYVSTDN